MSQSTDNGEKFSFLPKKGASSIIIQPNYRIVNRSEITINKFP